MAKKREGKHTVSKLCVKGATKEKGKVRISEGIILVELIVTEKKKNVWCSIVNFETVADPAGVDSPVQACWTHLILSNNGSIQDTKAFERFC